VRARGGPGPAVPQHSSQEGEPDQQGDRGPLACSLQDARGLTNPEVGLRYRRTVLEPGATAEPVALLQSFLERPVRSDALFEWLGLSPPAQPEEC